MSLVDSYCIWQFFFAGCALLVLENFGFAECHLLQTFIKSTLCLNSKKIWVKTELRISDNEQVYKLIGICIFLITNCAMKLRLRVKSAKIQLPA